MIVGRIVGRLLLLAGSAVLVRDLLLLLELGRWVPLTMADAWRLVDRASLIQAQALGGAASDIVLAAWTGAVLLALGTLLLIACRRRPQRRFPAGGISRRSS